MSRQLLPLRKQLYRKTLARAAAGPMEIPVAATCGLLNPDLLAQERDTATRMMAAAVEAWLAGALTAGVHLIPSEHR